MSKKDDKSSGAVFRYRSPTFSDTETRLLVQLVDKYKNPILSKSTLTSTNLEKDKAWRKLTKEFNRRKTGSMRRTDVLKTKWENLKRRFRKRSLSEVDAVPGSVHYDIAKSVIRVCTSHIGSNLDSNDEATEQNVDTDDDDEVNGWDSNDEKSSDGGGHKKRLYRSPTFSHTETQQLVQLVEKYKNSILNKSTLASANFEKDKAWTDLSKEFNHGNTSGYVRTPDVLKTKWENLKRSIRKISLGEADASGSLHYEIAKSVIRVCASEFESNLDSNDEASEQKEQKFNTRFLDDDDTDNNDEVNGWDCNDEKSSDNIDGVNKKPKYAIATMSPRDCRLLLHCVRQEKNELFLNPSLVMKNKAWNRVARVFNRRSTLKRSAPELKKKFQNLRMMVSRLNARQSNGNNYDKFDDDEKHREIKSEPKSDEPNHFSGSVTWSDDDDTVLHQATSVMDVNDDPLTNGVSSDSGLGSINNSENKEIDKIRTELLNYEMENAKLQRKRIEQAMAADKREQDLRELETSLRIRAARLEVLAAEAKLPLLHPGLNYTPMETRAQQYMTMYKT